MSRYISQTIQDSATIVTMNGNQHPSFPMVPVSMTLSDL